MVRAGIVLPSREALMAGPADAGLPIRVAERAEELGFDSVWIGDSLFHRPRFDPLTMLAAVAARTSRITVGTAVLIAALRHPLLLAQAIGTLDRIAEGRVVLGVGAGWIPLEFEAVGVPFEQREGRLRETMRVCRALWGDGGEPVTSRYWELPPVEIHPEPVQPGGPPVWIGGAGPKALRNAGRLFDGWVPTSPTPEAFASGLAQVRTHAEEAGRDPDDIYTGVYLTINLTDDRAAGEAEASRYAEDYYGIPYEVMRKAQAYFVGDVPACVEWLRGFRRSGRPPPATALRDARPAAPTRAGRRAAPVDPGIATRSGVSDTSDASTTSDASDVSSRRIQRDARDDDDPIRIVGPVPDQNTLIGDSIAGFQLLEVMWARVLAQLAAPADDREL